MGSQAHSTFEVGESSKRVTVGAQSLTKSTENKKKPIDSERVQLNPLLLVNPEPIKQHDKSDFSDLEGCSHYEMLESPEKVREDPKAETTECVDWSLILKDGRRVVIPDFSTSSWGFARVLPYYNSSD
ncbi:hypothetical protein FCV25MIE_27679 [Fagus crenata]